MHVFNLLLSSSSMCSCDGRKKVWDIIQEMAAHHHTHASCLVRNRPRCSSCLGLLQTKRKEQFKSRDVNLDQPIYTTTTPWLRTLTGILQYVAHDLSLTAGINFCDWNYTKSSANFFRVPACKSTLTAFLRVQCAISQVYPMFNSH